MWAGRTDGVTDKLCDDFNSSISFDSRMFRQDIEGSMAHAMMLGAKGIVTEEEAAVLVDGLQSVLDDLLSGKLTVDPEAEDIHMFVEQVLTERLGDVGKKLHTARSRNDQVALDLRMYLRVETDEIVKKLRFLLSVLTEKAEKHLSDVMPGYTHLQRAQPVTLGHHLMAYAMMFIRDVDRFVDCRKRMNFSPIGCCALAGTTYDTDRVFEAKKLGFDGVCMNSLDGVSDRDFVVEFCSCCSLTMAHLSRFCDELILWSGWEFRFVELSDDFTTGSSIMPQKKNPDMAELIRGKTGRVYGDLVGILTVLKGIPLAYNKDMQEDKEGVFDAADTVKKCLDVFAPMLQSAVFKTENMKKASAEGFINATDLADYLVKKGLPFRTAYKIAGSIVKKCIVEGKTLETLTLTEYQSFDKTFESDVYQYIDLNACVQKRISLGGTSPENVKKQIDYVRSFLS